MPTYHPNDVETKGEHFRDQTRRRKPWTHAELEAVRDAATALVRTRQLVDLPGKRTVPTFDGRAFWALMTALDRPNAKDG